MQHKEVSELAYMLRNDGDKLLDASSKLSLSSSLLSKINESISLIFPKNVSSPSDNFLDLHLLYDFIQQTLGLKIFPDYGILNNDLIDIKLFHNLRLLEVHRLSSNLIKGMKQLRSQLEYVTCRHSLDALKDLLENCGADRTQGYVWCELKEAVFSHNNLNTVDASLEFAPWLQSLDLSFNHIKTIETLNCLTNLKYLNLANNKIENMPHFTGQLCSKLRVLILRNNYIEDIKEIGALVNLSELDLCNNCLYKFECLYPLANLRHLNRLCLEDNPLNYHVNYRIEICKYLNISGDFLLDGRPLGKKELRVIGSVRPYVACMDRCESFNSATTASTVVHKKECYPTSDMEVSYSSVGVFVDINKDEVFQEQLGMQDSGFVAGPRPLSPSDSIGSANSLNDEYKLPCIRRSESDIEILSNPSQSSIEVLSSQTPKCIQSCFVIPQAMNDMCMDPDLKKLGDFHQSF